MRPVVARKCLGQYRVGMSSSPLALAALASVAVPDLDVYDVLRSTHADADFDVAVVVDSTGKRWTVRAAKRQAADEALAVELDLLGRLADEVDTGVLTFDVPRPAGTATTEDGRKVVVYAQIRGVRLNLAAVEPGPHLAASLGKALGQIHEISTSVIDHTGVITDTAEEHRARRLAELDAAAATSMLPPTLAQRWEEKLEDVTWWRFEPTVVHGSLAQNRVITSEESVVGIVHWADARVADPADDLAWLTAAAPADTRESIMEAYHATRREIRDPHLLDRALLASEMALARWLVHGVRTEDAAIVEDARGMLSDLVALVEGDPELP